MYVQPALRVDHPYGPMPQMGSGRIKDMGSTQFLRVTHGNYFNPANLSNNAAIYSLAGGASDSTYLKDSSNRLMLVADRSGNSAVNGLVLPGSSGNHATVPDSVPLSITGDITVDVWMAMNDWTPAANQRSVSKWVSTNGNRSWILEHETGGTLKFYWSNDGTATLSAQSTANLSALANFAVKAVRVTLDVDNGAAGNTVTFYTSDDFSTWSQLGDPVVTAGTTSVFDSPTQLQIGAMNNADWLAGIVRRVRIISGLGSGTTVFDANFTAVAKLAASFTESSANAATVTINTSGDTGARICGARDLVQMTQAKQPIFSVSGGYNIATFDGSNDYMKAAPFSLSQPESVYFVGSQVTWTNGRVLMDGNSNGGMQLYQNTTTPNITMFTTANGPTATTFETSTKAVLTMVFNGASSTMRVNRGTATTGNPGASNAGGFSVAGTAAGGSTANATFLEAILRSAADDAATQDRIEAFLIRKNGISA